MIAKVLPISDLNSYLVNPHLTDPNSMVALAGDLGDLPDHRIAVINSRQRRIPLADDSWLKTTTKALQHAVSKNRTLVSSVGMLTWEWITWNVNRLNGYQIIVIPRGKVSKFLESAHQITYEFNLNPQRIAFLMPFDPKKKTFRQFTYPERDRWVVALSHQIQPVAVRPSGLMSKLLNKLEISHRLDPSFRIAPYPNSKIQDNIRQLLTDNHLTPKTIDPELNHNWDYLTHWTRKSHGPWPGERKSDFYQDLFRAKNGYPRNGCNTLKRILTEQRIRGSNNLVRGNIPMVSLTQKSPTELLKIIRWRPGFIRWNFEPYGISIKRRTLESIGARPVTYGIGEKYEHLPQNQQPFFQRVEPSGKDWRLEEEWRILGDINLREIPRSDIIVWVMNTNQIKPIQATTTFPVHCFIE